MMVVQSFPVGEGRIVRGYNWYESGMVVADNLSPQKAALLLTLALTKTSNVDEIQRMFDEYWTERWDARRFSSDLYSAVVGLAGVRHNVWLHMS
jgi:glutaminase/asparaginase family protein